MKVKETLKSLPKKIKEFDYKKLLNTKAFLVVGCVMLIGIAVLVSTLVNRGGEGDIATGNESGNKVLGNSVLVDGNSSNVSAGTDESDAQTGADTDDFFALSAANRQKVRDEAMSVLREVAENPDTMPDAKEDALNSIAEMVDEMNAETNIETLVKSKGISECVAVISGGQCSIIVKSEGLLAEELARIVEIVYQQSGISPVNVKVIEKN